ncbi:MAG: class I SAM-dependent methyltransferase [Coprobacillaceae bacterium]
MNYYFYILIVWAVMLFFIKVGFSEVEGRMANKNYNIRWMLMFKQPFAYRRSHNIIFMSVLCYLVTSQQGMLSMGWLIELIGFIAVGVITDALAQVLSYYYVKLRFSKKINNAELLNVEIKSALTKDDTELIYHNDSSFKVEDVMQQYIQSDDHAAIISMDGGEFVEQVETLPAITYVVEALADKAKERLEDKGVKVTSYTNRNQLPFKDEKIDAVVNELTNYDKFEVYRVLNSGGYFIVDQMGSDNYKEIANMFIPFRMKGRWDKENCSNTLRDIGMNIVDSYEEEGYIRFKSLSAVLTFMRNFSPERVDNYEKYVNFYARILQDIKDKDFFDLTTHRFIVVAQKK